MTAKPIKIEFKKFSAKVPTGVYGHSLVLTKKLISIGSSYRQKHVDMK